MIFDKIKIRQLRSTDNEMDYQAVIESGFRPEGFPKKENLEQITKHEREHNEKKEFAYTILDIDGKDVQVKNNDIFHREEHFIHLNHICIHPGCKSKFININKLCEKHYENA